MGIVLVAFLRASAALVALVTSTSTLRREYRQPVELILGGPILDSYVLALNITECTEIAPEEFL
jgi:hypothetical protein